MLCYFVSNNNRGIITFDLHENCGGGISKYFFLNQVKRAVMETAADIQNVSHDEKIIETCVATFSK